MDFRHSSRRHRILVVVSVHVHVQNLVGRIKIVERRIRPQEGAPQDHHRHQEQRFHHEPPRRHRSTTILPATVRLAAAASTGSISGVADAAIVVPAVTTSTVTNNSATIAVIVPTVRSDIDIGISAITVFRTGSVSCTITRHTRRHTSLSCSSWCLLIGADPLLVRLRFAVQTPQEAVGSLSSYNTSDGWMMSMPSFCSFNKKITMNDEASRHFVYYFNHFMMKLHEGEEIVKMMFALDS